MITIIGRVRGRRQRAEYLTLTSPKDNKELLERAASLEGKNLKEFVQGAALGEARRVLLERSIISMSNEERDAFLALLR